jgi:hypothetical protein
MAFGGLVKSRSGTGWAESVPHAIYDDIVKGEPYQATFESTARVSQPDGQVTISVMCGAVLRDGEGRTRQEIFGFVPCESLPQPREARIITIKDDPNSLGHSLVLDPARKTFWRFSLGLDSGTPSRVEEWVYPGAQETHDSPEPVQMEGLTCRKVLIKTEDGESGAIWISDELHEVIREEIGTRCTWRLTDIVRGEPDPRLFEIPSGYKEATGRVDFEAPVLPVP